MRGKQVLNYTLVRILGEGGMAEVWYAENSLGVGVSVKVLKAEFCVSSDILERFDSEAAVMVRLKHRYVRKVLDRSTIDGRPAIIMEYLEGEDLSQAIRRGYKYSERELVSMWNMLVEALAYVHGQSVVHRDIKPSNIFYTTEGEVKLLDFGIAKMDDNAAQTRTGNFMGTMLYASPEQIEDPKRIDYRSDIYSLAVSFCHLISGVLPYDTNALSDYAILSRIVGGALVLDHLDDVWRSRLVPYLSTKPEDRPELTPIATAVSSPVEPKVSTKQSNPVSPRKKRSTARKSISAEEKTLVEGLAESEAKSPKYEEVVAYSYGLSRVKRGERYGFIDKAGQVVVPIEYDYIADFSDSLVKVQQGKHYGFIDRTGKVIIPIQYDWVYSPFKDGLAEVKLNGERFYINKSNKRVGNVIPSMESEEVARYDNGLIKVKRGEFYGLVGKNKKMILPVEYDYIGSFSEGLVEVAKDKKYGFVDQTGKIVIPLQYDWVYSGFKDGLAEVRAKDERLHISNPQKTTKADEQSLHWIFYVVVGVAVLLFLYVFLIAFLSEHII